MADAVPNAVPNAVPPGIDYFTKTFAMWPEWAEQLPIATAAEAPFDEFAVPLDAAAKVLPLVWSNIPLLDQAAAEREWWSEAA